MGLKSFSYGSYLGETEVPEKVLSLFKEAVSNGQEIHYASEIIVGGIKGRINLNRDFNLKGYEYAIENKKTINKHRRGKKELYIDFNTDDIEETSRSGGISENKLPVRDLEDAYEKFIDSEEVRYAVSQIKNLNHELLVVEEVNLIDAIRLAVSGYVNAVNEVKRICDFYPYIAEYVKVILSSGVPIEEVFA